MKKIYLYIRTMSKKWINALKEYNKGSSSWCIPKKGTEEYNNVIKIMNNDDNKKKAGSFLSNIIKSRLEENKHLKKVVGMEFSAIDYGNPYNVSNYNVNFSKKREAKKYYEDREKEQQRIAENFKKDYNMDINEYMNIDFGNKSTKYYNMRNEKTHFSDIYKNRYREREIRSDKDFESLKALKKKYFKSKETK